MPRKLVVIGGGVIGSEYAGTFAALGVEVHLVDGRDTLMPFSRRGNLPRTRRGDGRKRSAVSSGRNA